MEKSILEKFLEKTEQDNQNLDYERPEGTKMFAHTKEEAEAYRNALDELRNNENDPAVVYNRLRAEMQNLTEEKLLEGGLITSVDVKEVKVLKASCPQCGEEIICETPPMFNPYTKEKICRYVCPKCKTTYNLDHAYPRFALLDKDGNELEAFGL